MGAAKISRPKRNISGKLKTKKPLAVGYANPAYEDKCRYFLWMDKLLLERVAAAAAAAGKKTSAFVIELMEGAVANTGPPAGTAAPVPSISPSEHDYLSLIDWPAQFKENKESTHG